MSDEIPEGYTRVSEVIQFFRQKKIIHSDLKEALSAKAHKIMKRQGYIDEDVMVNKAKIGVSVHKAIENYFDDLPYELHGREVGYFTSFLKWAEKEKLVLVKKEERLFSETWKITGKFDAIMSPKGGDWEILIDFKCSAQADVLSWKTQAFLYCWLSNITADFFPCQFIQLNPKGEFPIVHTFWYSQDMKKMMEKLIETYRYFNPLTETMILD